MRDELEAAYRAASYRVAGPAGEFMLKVDQHSEPLANLLRGAGVGQAALLTAFNPQSEVQTAEWNRAAQARLRAELAAGGYQLVAACNGDPAGQWPVEESVLALGMDLAAARECAARYQQVAFLWMDAGGIPRLIETATALT
jgi:hypothetical protein